MSSSNQRAAPARKSRGRQKVKMEKMENHSNLQVTFSKRRAGLFKKASELCTLCGAEAAIVVFSPANKAYCFGHPNVQAVVDRLAAAAAAAPTNPRSQLIMEAHRNSNIRDLNIELTRVESLLRAERRLAEEIETLRKAAQHQRWLPTSLEDLDYAELSALKESVMGFKKNVDAKVQKEMFRLANPLPNPQPHHQNHPSVLAFDNNVSSSAFECPKLSLGFGDQNLNSGGSESAAAAADYVSNNYGWDMMFNTINVAGESNGASSSTGGGHGVGFFQFQMF